VELAGIVIGRRSAEIAHYVVLERPETLTDCDAASGMPAFWHGQPTDQ